MRGLDRLPHSGIVLAPPAPVDEGGEIGVLESCPPIAHQYPPPMGG